MLALPWRIQGIREKKRSTEQYFAMGRLGVLLEGGKVAFPKEEIYGFSEFFRTTTKQYRCIYGQ